MKKIKNFQAVTLIAAMLGVILFWVFGFYGAMKLSTISFFSAGGFGMLFLISVVVGKLRERHFCL